MGHLSRKHSTKDVELAVGNLLYLSLGSLPKQKIVNLFEDLLTPTEKIILGKRLTIALLLIRKYKYRDIRKTLKVSTATIRSVAKWLGISGRGFREALAFLEGSREWHELIKLIDDSAKVSLIDE
jgi:uncharacterized protein YerC